VPVIEEAVQLLRGTLPEGVHVELELPTEAPLVLADPSQLRTVVLNLGTNAAYAIGSSGIIRIELDSIPSTHEEIASSAGGRCDRYLRLAVSDTGTGMDAATIERIFEPFFTTKPTGQGNGLGLSVVHGIVKGHEGSITVQSQPGQGSVFRIYMPQSQAAALRASPAPPLRAPDRAARLMYVDDDWVTK
jgi:signal transduction histidine kinase